MTDYNVVDQNLSSDLDVPNRGTAPFNEIESFQDPDNGQRHDSEPTSEDAPTVQQLAQNDRQLTTPRDYKWGFNAKGDRLLVPTKAAVAALTELVSQHYHNKEERYFGLKHNPEMAANISNFCKSIKGNRAAIYISQVADAIGDKPANIKFTKKLAGIKRNLDNIDDRLGNSIIRAIGREAEQMFATGSYWLEYHRNTHWELTEKGNEDQAENALIRCEESRAQLLVAAQLLDYCVNEGFQPDMHRAATAALNLRGWSLTRKILDDQQHANRKQTQAEELKAQVARSINW